MSEGDFKREPFLFDSETDEDGSFPVFDPFSVEPAQMNALDADLNKPNIKIEKLAREVRPSHVFRFLDFLYAGGSRTEDSTEMPVGEQSSEMRRQGKLNWDY